MGVWDHPLNRLFVHNELSVSLSLTVCVVCVCVGGGCVLCAVSWVTCVYPSPADCDGVLWSWLSCRHNENSGQNGW